MQNPKTPSFLQAFFGSFFNFRGYQEYKERSGFSHFAHYLLVVTLCCCFYALFTDMWIKRNISPEVHKLTHQLPEIQIEKGKLNIDIEQPYELAIKGEKFGVIDTTREPEEYVEDQRDFLIIGESKMIVIDDGKKEVLEFEDADFALDAEELRGWVDKAEGWVLPGGFLLSFLWQFCWKGLQVLLVASVVTLVQSSRPNFGTHLKLACYALGPAMAFGVLVYGLTLMGLPIPFAGLAFWVILGGLTYGNSEQIRKSPLHS